MAKEIERKFLVKEIPTDINGEIPIQQGYLMVCPDGSELRIRKYGDKYFQTIKSSGTSVRDEIEIELTKEQFCALWPFTDGRRIEKSRILYNSGDHLFEIDIYKGKHKDLVIAELEFEDIFKSDSFSPPDWLGEEVTNNQKYKNQHLATLKINNEL